MNCEICGNYAKYKGKVKHYKIFECLKCKVSFVANRDNNSGLYNFLYSESEDYTNQKKITAQLKEKRLKLPYLSSILGKFSPVLHTFNKHDFAISDILEIGSGYGFLGYAITQDYNIDSYIGIDLSASAILYARKNFKNINFQQADAYIFLKKTTKQYDLIISLAVIEHLEDPVGFIKLCMDRLRTGGQLVLLTPNKDFWDKKLVWASDPPPRHWYFFNQQTFIEIAKKLKLQASFIDMNDSYEKENNLYEYIKKGKKGYK